MGILAKITNAAKQSNSNQSSSLATGGHAISKEQVLSPTDPTAINPMNAGTWETVRTTPVNHSPRYFTKDEANALKNLAQEKQSDASATKRAYKSLKRIEQSDAVVHTAHRGYIRGVADAELTKKRADAKTARHLHGQRPQYARLGFGLDRAEDIATARIAELKAKIQGKY